MNLDGAIGKALAALDLHPVTQLAMDLVSIFSRTGEEAAVAEFLADYLRQGGLEAELQTVAPNRANAIGVIRGEGDGPRVMFNGHLDTSITGVEDEDYPMTGPQGPASRAKGFVRRDHVIGCGARPRRCWPRRDRWR